MEAEGEIPRHCVLTRFAPREAVHRSRVSYVSWDYSTVIDVGLHRPLGDVQAGYTVYALRWFDGTWVLDPGMTGATLLV